MEKADDKAFEKEQEESRKHSELTKQSFERAFRNNPLSSETANAYNNLRYSDRPVMGNYKISTEDKKRGYTDRLRLELERFEKAYIDKGEEVFREFTLLEGYVSEKPELYDQICDYLGRRRLPELSEDLKYASEIQQLFRQDKDTKFNERKNFLIDRIQKLEKDGKARRVIQSQVVHEFEETFNDEISLRRLNGLWFAKGICLGGEVELSKHKC